MKKSNVISILSFMILFLNLLTVKAQDCGELCDWTKVFIKGTTINCGAYQDVFYDGFDSTSLDQSKWQTYLFDEDESHPYARINHPSEEQLYMDENVIVEDGKCKLIGKKDVGAFSVNYKGDTLQRDITSGVIKVRQSVGYFRYAYYEAKIRNPGVGWWPAFWLWHWDEIDIMENFANNSRYNYNLYGSNKCKSPNVKNAPLDDGEFHTFAAELTPFSLTYFYNGLDLPKKYYRFYNDKGEPLKVDCTNNVIPEGYYYINPIFPQSRKRTFQPIINLAVLPKYGLKCPILGCDGPYCYECGENGDENCNWGYPLKPGCILEVEDADLPGTMEIEYVLVRERDYGICNSIAIFGDNCRRTDDAGESLGQADPVECGVYCVGSIGNLYLEDLNGDNWLSEVQVDSVKGSPDVDIISFDNYNIKYRQNWLGEGKITIYYIDGCGQAAIIEYTLKTLDPEDYEILELDQCKGILEVVFGEESQCFQNAFEIQSIILTNGSGEEFILEYQFDNRILNVDFNGLHLPRMVTINVINQCTNLPEEIEIEIPPCDECCPTGFEYDGANCYSGFHFNPNVRGFIENGGFYTERNCDYYPLSNNCCPNGTTFDGTNCYFGPVESGFNGFVLNNTFYTDLNCEKNCCPVGFEYDGANCYSGFHYNAKTTGFIVDDKFYSNPDCTVYDQDNNCCPKGTTLDANGCYYMDVPKGYNGFVLGNTFYVEPNCTVCCPEETVFDGEGCKYEIYFPDNEGIIIGDGLFVRPNCSWYPLNKCCPEGSTFDGENCDYGVKIPEGYIGYVGKNNFYIEPIDCYGHYDLGVNVNKIEEAKVSYRIASNGINEKVIKIFPNPFVDGFMIDCSSNVDEIQKICIYALNGKYNKEILKDEIKSIIEVSDIEEAGLYIVNIITNTESTVYKVINLKK